MARTNRRRIKPRPMEEIKKILQLLVEIDDPKMGLLRFIA